MCLTSYAKKSAFKIFYVFNNMCKLDPLMQSNNCSVNGFDSFYAHQLITNYFTIWYFFKFFHEINTRNYSKKICF